ncbi:hypothetical protein [Crenothrix polyspora]|uniref:Uncharacterized protein n=1 Tax=Crenothrix polyspora TaxID=360316 RepID=A0A1R4HEK1_9GAMM|nr:hypothetical protein [Crenothrix polyspora]SJM94320.1 hypothetical protein CRENPOLYSF1_530016 [Crenothrix polyspora]
MNHNPSAKPLILATYLRRDTVQGLTVRPEPVEGWAVKPIMVRQAHHERLNLKLSRLKWIPTTSAPLVVGYQLRNAHEIT